MEDIRKGVCPLCKHNEILRKIPEYLNSQQRLAPLTAHNELRQKAMLGLEFVGSGHYSTYVCRKCGFTQWFTDQPETIPIGAEQRTSLIKGADTGPYR